MPTHASRLRSPLIANATLRAADVPETLRGWQDFALTFDGYKVRGGMDGCAAIANKKKPRTLSEYRACLFFEQRRWRHFGVEPDAKTKVYLRSLLAGIRSELEKSASK